MTKNLQARAPWIVAAIVLVVLPLQLNSYWVGTITQWMPLAIAALGLNLLTGYNGQISVGHGALYGAGAYTTALLITNWRWGFLGAILGASVVCFLIGVLIGLPALRIKGLYLALVTLAVATLFPQILEMFSKTTGGSTGLSITSPQIYRGSLREKPVRFLPPEGSGLATDQWKYYFFLAITLVCFILVRNLVKSRFGRSLVAIRDNEVAAAVSGVNVASAKVITFGVSSALAGIGGGLAALANDQPRIASGSFTIETSLYFLVAVVVGGAASIIGPAIGAIAYGLFLNVLTPELPEDLKASTPLILGGLLIVLMLTEPGGIVGLWRRLSAAVRRKRHRHSDRAGHNKPETIVETTGGNQ